MLTILFAYINLKKNIVVKINTTVDQSTVLRFHVTRKTYLSLKIFASYSTADRTFPRLWARSALTWTR